MTTTEQPGSAVAPAPAGSADVRSGLPPIVGTPSDIVAALYGSDSVTLPGFGAPPLMPSWVRPGMQFLNAQATPSDLEHSSQRRRRLMQAIAVVALVATHAGIGAVSAWWAGSSGAPSSSSASAPLWRVVAVREDGLQVRIGGDTSPVVLLKVGAVLPSGERLSATIPSRGAYVTDTATIVVRSR